MFKTLLVLLTAVSSLASASIAAAQVPDEPIHWALATEKPDAKTTRGGTITLALTATIDEGWHLYSLTLPAGGPIPTRITIPTGQEFAAAGDVIEPATKSSFDSNFNMTLEYFEEKATFGVPLKASMAAGWGDVPARVAVSYQTCNDKFCLPPKQVVVTAQVKVMPSTADQPPMPPDRDAFNKALQIKDVAAQITAIEKYAVDFPASDTVYFAAARGMRAIGDADGVDTARLAAFVRAIESAMDDAGTKSSANQYQRANVYYTLASRLVSRSLLIDDAVRLASKSVPLLNEGDFMAKELAVHNERQAAATKRTPGRTPDPFSRAESEATWTGIRASHLSVQGRALLLQGHTADAQARLKESYALAPVMETALALSSLAEKAGLLNDALTYAVTAQLTGKMTATEFAQLDAIYKKTHNGSLNGLDALLDKTFAAKHVNPVVAPKYAPTPARTNRTVLAEMFTGAGCVPCVSVDLSLERVLERYSRNEVALLVYHIHAPSSDPYSNFSVEARSAYYGVHGAPTVLLDGSVAGIGEGGGPLATTIFPKLDAAIGKRLETKAEGRIVVEATRSGDVVQVTVQAPDAPASAAHLHTVLVETTASYSGENGLRIQPMIVRAMQGKGQGTALPMPGPAAVWPIDLKALAADNLAYYDWYIADLKKRANIDTSFREKRPAVDPSRLAIVAFLQDDITHEVLQSVFVPIK